MMKKLILFFLTVITGFSASSQILHPVTWSYAAKKTKNNEATVFLKATIDDGWHIYSQNVKSGGPIKTSFTFSPSKAYSLVGKTIEPKALSRYEDTFKMNVSYFEKSVVFQQKIKLTGSQATVKGMLTFMTCNDSQCQPPEEVSYSIPIK